MSYFTDSPFERMMVKTPYSGKEAISKIKKDKKQPKGDKNNDRLQQNSRK